MDVSEFRIEKRKAEASLTLTTGPGVRGCFFLSGSAPSHAGPERVADLLNAESGFFPFELAAGGTVLYNRSHLVLVTLLGETSEAELDPGYSVATERVVHILLSNDRTLDGRVRVFLPAGRDRLSDYAREPEPFRYVETGDGTVIVNVEHIVALRETTPA